jgi:iron(III) transport system substrate-binding protein
LTTSLTRLLISLVLAAGLLSAWYVIARRASGTLVVYCTHDLVYAEPVLEEFTRQTGIQVTIVGDTEATKSLGLIERLLREGDQTPCDLVWNNEVLGTIRLQRNELLAPYTGPASQRIPKQFRDREGHWHGFAGRMRVWIMREGVGVSGEGIVSDEQGASAKGQVPREEASGHQPSAVSHQPPSDAQPSTLNPQPSPRMAIAKPLYGTTFTQFAMLWHLHGAGQTQLEHLELVEHGVRFVAGNAMVRDLVAGGSCDIGMTDTDDVFAARDAGYKVSMQPIRIDGKTLCIPNTVALLRSSDRPAEARQLLEYLLSEEVELQLAKTARQIPLGTVPAEKIPEEVRPLVAWASESWNIADAADVAGACLEWLKSEYAR